MSCYLCKTTESKEAHCGLPLCQDCGLSYCEDCFDTPCHDLCNSIEPYHYSNKDCPHWSWKKK